MKSVRSWAWYGVALAGLLLVFIMYTRPDFMVTVANQVWACF
jgi:hypothetical protein